MNSYEKTKIRCIKSKYHKYKVDHQTLFRPFHFHISIHIFPSSLFDNKNVSQLGHVYQIVCSLTIDIA